MAGMTPVHAGSTNLALNKTATASSLWAGTLPSNAVDGNPRSEWGPSTASGSPWLKVDLGSVTQFNSYVVETWSDRANSAITLETSNDDLTWTVVDTVSGSTTNTINQTLSQPVSARYVKVTINSWSFFPAITEFQLYSNTPDAPTELAAITSDGQVTLNWSSVLDATSYKVYQGTSPGIYDAAPVATVNGTTTTLTGLTNGTTYYFTVRSSNEHGDSSASNEVSAKPQIAPPTAPTGLTATAGNGQVTLSWNSVSGAVTYDVYKGTTLGSYESIPVATVSGATYSYTETGLTNGMTYFFVVKASNSGGNSDNSNEASATPQVPVPGVPVLVPATAGDSHVSLTWSPIIGSTEYKIFKSTTSGAYGSEETTVSGSIYSYDVTGLENGTTYYFIVKATNPGGESAASNEVSETPKTVPSSPTDVTATAGNQQATVSFSIPVVNGGSPITGYEVTASPGNITAIGAASPITVTGLSNGTMYTFTVKAVNGAGSSAASAVSKDVTPTSPSRNRDKSVTDTSSASSTSTISSTPTISPAPAPTPEPAQPTVDVFKSSIVNVASSVKAIESKVAEAKQANAKIEMADIKGHWAEKAIDTFVKLQIIKGYGDGQFKPNGNITRAEFAMLISRAFDISGGADHSAAMSDISSHWAKEAIEKLANAGVIGGYGDGTFKPNQTISREEMAIILSRIVNLSGVNKDDSKGNFTDISIASSFATNAIKDVAEAGIINGKSNGAFDPQGNATRAEALTIVLNALNLHPQVKNLVDSLN
ncbi:S-layer homology domain-containing protein [Paenibacillus peoriae]|uniref:S-layer homology domain-containing protein n=1 Tax=Paenibacillus peoriae TaxID=59893 RepID=UPI001F5294E1|nr:S-layer homology domain-containing protein [Paenibacillus peoriae]MEC0180297.1 S-layer homology domain-containing protein [Paenibacillus peoriae]